MILVSTPVATHQNERKYLPTIADIPVAASSSSSVMISLQSFIVGNNFCLPVNVAICQEKLSQIYQPVAFVYHVTVLIYTVTNATA